MDRSGRLVVPKALRDAAGIRPGDPLEIRVRDGILEIEPLPATIELVEKDGILIAVAPEGTPVLEADAVSATLDALRRERG